MATDNGAVSQAAADAVGAEDAAGNDANVPNVVVVAVGARDMLNAATLARQTVDRHFDWHRLNNCNKLLFD